jgi:hypothetical protein
MIALYPGSTDSIGLDAGNIGTLRRFINCLPYIELMGPD